MITEAFFHYSGLLVEGLISAMLPNWDFESINLVTAAITYFVEMSYVWDFALPVSQMWVIVGLVFLIESIFQGIRFVYWLSGFLPFIKNVQHLDSR